MANKNLLDFVTTTVTNAGDYVHLNQGGIDKKIRMSDFLASLEDGNPHDINVVNDNSTARTITLSDMSSYIRFTNASFTTVTIDTDANQNFKVNDMFVVRKAGLGDVLITGASGVIVNQAASGSTLSEIGQCANIVKVNDNEWDIITGGNATTSIQGGATFATVATMKTGDTVEGGSVDYSVLAAQNAIVETVWNNSTSKKGGAKYIIKTAAQVTADGDTIDGNRNHWLLGGTAYAAILLGSRVFFTRGAIADGATDQGALLGSQLLLDKSIELERGNFAIESLSLSDDNLIIKGEGNQITRLTPTAVSPAFAISMTNDYTHLEDMRLGAAGTNMIQQSGNSYYNYFNNVWFGPSDVAIDVGSDFYWSNFVACHFRDNDSAITCDTGQDFNAVTFLGGSFYHFDAASAGPSVDVFGGDGVAFMGTHVQNQGMKFDTMDGVEIAGGYWECYDVATIEAINSNIHLSGGIYFPNASLFKMDKESINKLKGYGPNLVAKDSEGILYPDNSSQATAIIQQSVKNLFDDGSCSSQKAIDALAYSPTGLPATRVINGSNNVEISFATVNHRAGFRIPAGRSISVFVKWRATAGTGRLAMQNVTDTVSLIHNSATDSEWRYSHWHCTANGANPSLVFDPQSDTSTVIEVDTIIATDNFIFLTEKSPEYQMPSGRVTMPSSATVAVTFNQPPTGNYRIFLQGDANETFWYSAKTATGFTINSSNATSTANVYWEVRLG